VQAWAETVRRFTPDLPVPAAVTALTEQLPKAEDVYDDVFSFAEQVLGNSRDYTKRLLDAAALDGGASANKAAPAKARAAK
jgi:alpha-D-ribose 1-methylphosphonate 5-triphosphate synthase subunit PhnI